MKISLLLCFFIPLLSLGQTYKKAKGLSDEEFVSLVFPDLEVYEAIYSGSWGGSHKILVTYLEDEDFKSAYLLSQAKKRRYELIDFPYEFGMGVYPRTSNIDTVLFQDCDNDKVTDMLIIENGIWRCRVEIEEENPETGEIEVFETGASCEVCAYSVFSVKNNKVEVIAGDEDIDWNCDKALIFEAVRQEIEDREKQ